MGGGTTGSSWMLLKSSLASARARRARWQQHHMTKAIPRPRAIRAPMDTAARAPGLNEESLVLAEAPDVGREFALDTVMVTTWPATV